MAMNVGDGKEDDVMMEVNTTPLIDVMLVLLIMLIITIPIQTHAVKLDMPQNLSAPPISNSTSTARCSGTVSPSRTPARNAFATVKDPNPTSLAQIWIVLTR